jgi:hypothetical protein
MRSVSFHTTLSVRPPELYDYCLGRLLGLEVLIVGGFPNSEQSFE